MPVAKSLRLAVVEDEPLYRELLVTGLISRLPNVIVVGSFSSGEELFRSLDPASVDVLLAGLPDDVRGGWSYLLKTSVSDIEQLGLAIRESAAGGVVIDSALTRTLVPTTAGPLRALTHRQVEILARVANGWSNKKIADDLVLSVRTVESVISDIIHVLKVPKDNGEFNARVTCVLLYLRHTVSRSTRASTSHFGDES